MIRPLRSSPRHASPIKANALFNSAAVAHQPIETSRVDVRAKLAGLADDRFACAEHEPTLYQIGASSAACLLYSEDHAVKMGESA